MTQGVPPHADLHPMRAMFKIPFLPPPTLAHPEFYSIAFQQFLSRILVKDPVRRATALQLQTDLFISKFGVNGGGEGGNSNLNNHKLSQKEEVDMRYPLLLKVWEVMQRREELKQRKLAKLRQYQAQQELHQQHHQQKFDIVVKSRRRVGGGEGGKGKMPDVVPSGLFPMDTSTSLPLSTLLPSSASSSSSSSSSVIIASTFDPAMDSIDSIRLDAEEKQLEDNSRLVGTSIAPARKRLFHDHDNASFDSSLAAQNSVLDFGIATGYEGGGGGGGGSEGEGYAHDLDRQLHHHQRYLLDSPDALLSNCFNTTSSVTSEQSVITVKRLAATKNSATTQIVPINTPNDFDSVVVYHDQPHQLVNVDLLSGSGGGKGDKRGTSTSPGATQRTPSLAMKKSKSSSSSSSLVSTSSSSDRLSVIMAPPHHPPPSPPSSANNLHHDSEEKAIGGISPLRIFKTTTTTGTINGATSGINSLFGGGGGGGGGRRKSHQSILSTTTSTTTSSLHEDHHHHHSSPVIPSGLMNPFQKTIFGKNVAIRLRNRLQRFKQRMAGLIVMDHLDDTEDEEEEEDEGVSADEDGRFGTIVPHGRRQTSHHHGRRNQNGKKVAVEMVDKCVQADEEDTDGSTPIMRTCSLASSSSSSTSPPTPITTENDSAVEDLSRPISPMSTTPKPSPFITTSTSSSPRPPSSKYPLGDTFESLFSPNKPLYPHQHQNHDQAVASRDRTIAMMHFAYISVIILVLVIQY